MPFGSIHILMPSLFERDKWERGSVCWPVPNFYFYPTERMSNQFGVLAYSSIYSKKLNLVRTDSVQSLLNKKVQIKILYIFYNKNK